MTEISSERLEEMLDAEIPLEMSTNEFRSILTELRDRRAAGGEAVAWLVEEKAFGWNERVITDEQPVEGPRVRNIRPLYLHPSNSGVAVKALEWRHSPGVEGKVYEEWRSSPIVGEYFIHKTKAGFKWFTRAGGDDHTCRTLEEAKSAAQSDYERRILSALHPSPDTGKGSS